MAISQKQAECVHSKWTVSKSTKKGTRRICNHCGLECETATASTIQPKADYQFRCRYCGDVVPVGMDYCTNCTNENPENVPRDTINCVYIEYYDVVGKIESWATIDEAIDWAKGDIGLNKVVGWVIEVNDKFTLIGSHKADNPNSRDLDQWGQLTRIPTSIITKKVNLVPNQL